MYEDKNAYHCIMLLDEHGDDGLLIEAEGFDYPRLSMFVPDAALIYERYKTSEAELKLHDMIRDTIDIGLFKKEEYKQVSAIIFTCTLTIGKLTSSLISNGFPPMGSVFTIHENTNATELSNHLRFQAKVITPDYKEEISEGVFVFHNPNASNPIPDSFLVNTCVTNVYLEDEGIRVKGNNPPLVARYSSFVPIEALIPSIKELLRLYNHITVEEFYSEYE